MAQNRSRLSTTQLQYIWIFLLRHHTAPGTKGVWKLDPPHRSTGEIDHILSHSAGMEHDLGSNLEQF